MQDHYSVEPESDDGFGPATDLAMSLLAIFLAAFAMVGTERNKARQDATEFRQRLEDTTGQLTQQQQRADDANGRLVSVASELTQAKRTTEALDGTIRDLRLSVDRSEQRARTVEATLNAERANGFVVPVPLAVRIDWNRHHIDVDLAITGPDGTTARYPLAERNRSHGNLMRDEVRADKDTWEVYYAMDPPPGAYRVACSYYSGSGDPVEVRGVVVLHPADAARRMEQSFRIVLRPTDKYPQREVAEFRIERSDGQPARVAFGRFVRE